MEAKVLYDNALKLFFEKEISFDLFEQVVELALKNTTNEQLKRDINNDYYAILDFHETYGQPPLLICEIKNKMSVKKISEACNMHYGTFLKYAYGQRVPKNATHVRNEVASVLGIDPRFILFKSQKGCNYGI